jgi:HEAT repeat protein
MRFKITTLLIALVLLLAAVACAQEDEGYAARREAGAAAAVQQLSDRDPLIRQRAAEVLAGFSAVEQQRLVEGYRLQEKNDRVRLALDWALYRMGKRDALYGVVNGLRSDSRRTQAVGYLSQLPGPRSLEPFFMHTDNKTLIGLLEVMASVGDADTLELVKPYMTSLEPKVAEAARFAEREITSRLAQPQPDTLTRPREVGKGSNAVP